MGVSLTGEMDPWRKELSDYLDRLTSKKIRQEIILDDLDPDDIYRIEENISWTRGCLERMDHILDEGTMRDVLTSCAHIMPEDRISKMRDFYRRTGDIDAVMEFWQADFLENLKRWVDPLQDEWSKVILDEHWGEVGVREGNTIHAIKIPADMKGYFEAKDDIQRRRAYCHCARIRDCIGTEEGMPPIYCYCGAGFYKSNWERVLERPVRVEVLRSVMQGDDLCQIAIHLEE